MSSIRRMKKYNRMINSKLTNSDPSTLNFYKMSLSHTRTSHLKKVYGLVLIIVSQIKFLTDYCKIYRNCTHPLFAKDCLYVIDITNGLKFDSDNVVFYLFGSSEVQIIRDEQVSSNSLVKFCFWHLIYNIVWRFNYWLSKNWNKHSKNGYWIINK